MERWAGQITQDLARYGKCSGSLGGLSEEWDRLCLVMLDAHRSCCCGGNGLRGGKSGSGRRPDRDSCQLPSEIHFPVLLLISAMLQPTPQLPSWSHELGHQSVQSGQGYGVGWGYREGPGMVGKEPPRGATRTSCF